MNLALLETFHSSVHRYRAADHDTCAQVTQRIRQHMAHERDLLLAPGFFLALAQQQPAITHVEVWPKRGRFHNQLTRFRYEAVLHIGDAVEPIRDLAWLDWQRQKLTVAEVRRRLSETRPETLAIRNIPNARLDEEVAALDWLREAGPEETIAQLRAYLAQQPRRGIEPDDLWALRSSAATKAEPEYHVELSWLNTDAHGVYDVVFTRHDQLARPAWFTPAWVGGDARRRAWSDYANHPQRAKLNRELIPQVRQFLQDKLPHYMMPAVFTVLEKLPLSPTGKIDRHALAQSPVRLEPVAEETLPVTHTPVEKLLTNMWADVLNLNRVGVDDDFFALGGNSLKAMALTHRLQRQLNRTFRPLTLLQAPTVAQFAAYLQETYPDLPAQLATTTHHAAAGTAGTIDREEGDI